MFLCLRQCYTLTCFYICVSISRKQWIFYVYMWHVKTEFFWNSCQQCIMKLLNLSDVDISLSISFFWQLYFPMSNCRKNYLVYLRLMEIVYYILYMYSFYNKFGLFVWHQLARKHWTYLNLTPLCWGHKPKEESLKLRILYPYGGNIVKYFFLNSHKIIISWVFFFCCFLHQYDGLCRYDLYLQIWIRFVQKVEHWLLCPAFCNKQKIMHL